MRLDHDELSCPMMPAAAAEEARSVAHNVSQEPPQLLDAAAAKELSRKIAASGIQNDAFLLANEDQLMANFTAWTRQFPKLKPCYDVSFNACPWLLEFLDQQSSEDCSVQFSCQNKGEIQYLLEQGIDAKKIIFSGSSPKLASHIKFANASQVPLISFGSQSDLKKLSTGGCIASSLLLSLENPTGHPDRQWLDLLNSAKDAGFNVQGVAFQGQLDLNKMLALAKMATSIGRSMGHEMKIIDIGNLQENVTLMQKIINGLEGVAEVILCHLGSEFIENVFSLGAKVIGKHNRSLIINDGIFGTFKRLLVDENYALEQISALKKSSAAKKVQENVDIYGPSGDDLDILVEDYPLDTQVHVDDWLFFPKMGAFSYGIGCQMISVKLPGKFGNFRLFSPPEFVPSSNAADHEINDDQSQCLNNDMADLLSDEGSLEVIFLDIQGETAEQQTCLDLFEELPSLASDQDSVFWEDFYADLR